MMNFPQFKSDYKPAPTERMHAYHKSSASLGDEEIREWCCVAGFEYNTDADAVDVAQAAYGGNWIMPYFAKPPHDWQSNPKKSRDGKHLLWLLVRA